MVTFCGSLNVYASFDSPGISTNLVILYSMSSFVPKYWLNWQILLAILVNFIDKDGTTKVRTGKMA